MQDSALLRGGTSSQAGASAKLLNSRGTTLLSSNGDRERGRRLKKRLDDLERALKAKLSLNYNNVRKAFLDLDKSSKNHIAATDLAEFLKSGVTGLGDEDNGKASAVDFTLLETLIRVRCKQDSTDISYGNFCKWLGQDIQTKEAFYFRHDSHRNPQYDLNMRRTVEPNLVTQKAIRGILTGNGASLKQAFIERVKLQFRTIKKAYIEMDRHRQGHITLDTFKEILESWGFVAKDKDVRDLFDWLDEDKDQKITLLDLKHTIGFEILPQETYYFRQDVKPVKKATCQYDDCWEFMKDGQRGVYCPMHKKVVRNLVMDKFEIIHKKINAVNFSKLKALLEGQKFISSIENF